MVAHLVKGFGVAKAGGLGSGSLGQTRSISRLHIVGQVTLAHIGAWQVKGQVTHVHVAQRILQLVGQPLHIRSLAVCLSSCTLGCICCLSEEQQYIRTFALG